ncbi:hypothetical protein [Falsirhodobacter deserti]|uniref:hypothetical protein n=1 Tax=Falsirhodobacter deserti TaxID=1365611 RepID=UPI001F4D90FA|nr:hypothetical protein [Falsirhodobacter deserti]
MKDKVSAPLIALADVRGRLFPLLPVLMGIGIGWWFSLTDEPGRCHIWRRP